MEVQSIQSVPGVRINVVHNVRWKVPDSQGVNIPLVKSNGVMSMEANIL